MNAHVADAVWNREQAFFAFLRAELAPSPARWRDALRLTLLCAVATALVMTFHIPYGEFLIIFFFAVSQPDAWASFRKARLRGIGTLFGGALAILVIVACGDKPWLFFIAQGLVFATGQFLTRVTTIPYAVLLGTFTFVIAVPTVTTDPEASLDKVFWRILLTSAGAILGTVAQLLLWPDHPEKLLLRELVARLQKVEAVLTRMADGRRVSASNLPAQPFGRAALSLAMSRELDLLASAEAGSPTLRKRHADQIKLLTDIEASLFAALRLKDLVGEDGLKIHESSTRDALQLLCRELARCRRALEAGRSLTPAVGENRGDISVATPSEPGESPAVVSALNALRQTVCQLPASLGFLAVPGTDLLGGGRKYDPIREPIVDRTIFTPACKLSNVEAIRFALKGALAASICYVIYQALDWPGISTCVVTCLITAQSSFGAGLQKSLLRLAGATVGGLAAVAAILVLWPNMESLASLMVVTSILFFGASWINCGGSRISYVGMQIGLVLALVLVNQPGQTIALAPAGDRILGVFLGIIVMGFIDLTLWPNFAVTAMQRKLADILRALAKVPQTAARQSWEQVREAAFEVHRQISAALNFYTDSQFEFGSPRQGDTTDRGQLLALTNRAEEVFLRLIAVIKHRNAIGLAGPAATTRQLQSLDEAIGQRLEAMASFSTLAGTREHPGFDQLLDELAANTHEPGAGTDSVTTHRQDSEIVALYREVIESLQRLEAETAAAAAETATAKKLGVDIGMPSVAH